MKNIFLLLLILLINKNTALAQGSIGFNYNTTVRNNLAQLIVNENVQFRFNIKKGSLNALPIYSEIHQIKTDNEGKVNLVIGKGSFPTSNFTQLNWGNDTYFLGIELDRGNGFIDLGTDPLLSVPFAAYAFNSRSTLTANIGQVLTKNNSANNLRIINIATASNLKDAINKKYVDDLEANVDENTKKLDSFVSTLKNY
jgi:hypothetical protein